MLGGYVDFFMDPSLVECYVKLKEELDQLLQKKVNVLVPFFFPIHIYLSCNFIISRDNTSDEVCALPLLKNNNIQ